MKRVAIIAAFSGELKPLVRGWARKSRGGVGLWLRRHADGEWVAACAGIGADAAARAFTEVERDGPVDMVISTGWAGALSADFAAGRAFGVCGVIDARTGERFPASGSGDVWLVTSHRVAGEAEKLRLAAAHGAGLVDMEAAQVARLAAARGIPFLCVKGVSDGPSERLPDFNLFIAKDGRFQMARFILFAAVRPWLWPALVRMDGNGRKSARSMRESLLGVLEGRGADGRRNGSPDPER
ncbi:MAG TPA: hypothetical protein VKG78_08820 [Opitutaceae bacterium]|nr:hypothetical protein [Opitutaceae bacterium]